MKSLISVIFLAIIGFATTAFAQVNSVDCPGLTPLQRFIMGLTDFGNILFVGGILGTVVFLVWLLYLIKIPVVVYEFCGYTVSIGLVVFANKILLGIDPVFIAFAGCIGFAAMLAISATIHGWEKKETEYFTLLAVIWGVVAAAYQSELIGFFSVGALFGALGFFVRSYPFMTVIGFEDEDALNRATGTAFILLALFVAYRVFGTSVPYAKYFSYGTYVIGSLVGFTGLLILAYEGYSESRGWGVRQMPIIIGGLAALYFGSVYAIPELQKIGGTFFGLYLLEKVCDIPTKGRVGWVFKCLVISSMALGTGYVILRYKDFFAPYIFMM